MWDALKTLEIVKKLGKQTKAVHTCTCQLSAGAPNTISVFVFMPFSFTSWRPAEAERKLCRIKAEYQRIGSQQFTAHKGRLRPDAKTSVDGTVPGQITLLSQSHFQEAELCVQANYMCVQVFEVVGQVFLRTSCWNADSWLFTSWTSQTSGELKVTNLHSVVTSIGFLF